MCLWALALFRLYVGVHPHYSAPCSCLNRADCQSFACLTDRCVVSLSHISSASVRKRHSGPDFPAAWQCNGDQPCTSVGLVDEVFMTSDRYLLSDLWESTYSLPGMDKLFQSSSDITWFTFRRNFRTCASDHCNRQIDKQANGLGGLVVLKLKPARLSH